MNLLILSAFLLADPPPSQVRVALVNLRSLYTDGADARANLDANVARHLAYIDLAARQKADFVGFPELSLNGYRLGKGLLWLKADSPAVQALAKKAKEKGLYVAFGMAEEDADGKRWNAHLVLGPDGKLVGKHRKIWLTAEKGHVSAGDRHDVFDVKGLKVGIAICADGSDPKNLEALAKNGAKLIYGPHCNSTGGTTAKWYAFRSKWAGPEGWIAKLGVHAALHNNAGGFGTDVPVPPGKHGTERWASGAWFLGPDGKTLAQMPSSMRKADSVEHLLIQSIPLK